MKKILIVGASSGIGLALAESLQDMSIISLSRNKPQAKVDLHIPYDVLSDVDPPLFEGPIDGLVYCPGSIVLKPFKLLKAEDFRNEMEINLIGAVRVIRHYLPSLVSAGHASIVLFSSVAARTGMPYHSAIAASKAAVEGLMISLAAELAPSIRVNAIAPSLVKTPLATRLTDSDQKIAIAGAKHPLKRIGATTDIAGMAAFLLSDAASWITGQVIHVDGGLSTLKT